MGFKVRQAKKDSPSHCPNCGDRLVPIAYGFPGPELDAEASRGDIILGGCNFRIDGIDATHLCKRCNRRFFEFEAEFLPIENWRKPKAALPSTNGSVAIFLEDASGARRMFEIPEEDLDFPYFSALIGPAAYGKMLCYSVALWNRWRLGVGEYNAVDLGGLRAGGANLSGAELAQCNLAQADLSHANLSGAILDFSDLTETSLSGANLRGASVQGVEFDETELDSADLEGLIAISASLVSQVLDGLNLEGADLRRADLSGSSLRAANLSGADLSEATLRDTDLRGADLRGANLSESVLDGADLRGAKLDGVNLTDARTEGAKGLPT